MRRAGRHRDTAATWQRYGDLLGKALSRGFARENVRRRFWLLVDRQRADAGSPTYFAELERFVEILAKLEPALLVVFPVAELRLFLARLVARSEALERGDEKEAERVAILTASIGAPHPTEVRAPSEERFKALPPLVGVRPGRGRPRGARNDDASRTDLEKRIRVAVAHLRRTYGLKWPSVEQVAQELGMGGRTLERAADVVGLDLRALRREK